MSATKLFASIPLVDDELTLVLSDTRAAGLRENDPLTYRFAMQHSENGARIGSLSVRIADSEYIVQYFGHIGYGVYPFFRGHRYAARACRLVLPVFAHHDIDPIWITCNPDNMPSRHTCELIGAELINIVDVPKNIDLYLVGDRQKCRYRLSTDNT
ncbi:MAG TPA: GNAT family N-acetyltransferase [Candidatus Latescibacteria bacterium]|nr:GNAT family N-acetyltransferase [Candidatus Handelsmanbacteria bacterium]HIL07988.1 GNAT family N-acetyltransferase [Candidatus Latescibacterota bacterium]